MLKFPNDYSHDSNLEESKRARATRHVKFLPLNVIFSVQCDRPVVSYAVSRAHNENKTGNATYATRKYIEIANQ